jgi:hypothetical protein
MGNKGKKTSWKIEQEGGGMVSTGTGAGRVDKRDFDANRPLLRSGEGSSGRSTALGDNDGDGDGSGEGEGEGYGRGRGGSVLSEVVDEIRERDRRKVRMNVVRTCSFVWGVMSWFVSLVFFLVW